MNDWAGTADSDLLQQRLQLDPAERRVLPPCLGRTMLALQPRSIPLCLIANQSPESVREGDTIRLEGNANHFSSLETIENRGKRITSPGVVN